MKTEIIHRVIPPWARKAGGLFYLAVSLREADKFQECRLTNASSLVLEKEERLCSRNFSSSRKKRGIINRLGIAAIMGRRH